MKRLTLLIQTGSILLLLCMSAIFAQDSRIIFPRPFFMAIDDMGWNEGGSRGDTGGGWRVGLRRDFDERDYACVVEVGKAVGVRFQGAFLLEDMDRMNICADYPTTTQQGAEFDNSANIDITQLETMKYIHENSAYLEFGIHGVGHEHWIDGERRRAEWYNLQDNYPWTEADTRAHLECFKKIMTQYGWTPENGQSFPESFVPCAYGYYWNPDGAYSTGKLMAECGVKYVNTLFSEIPELNPPSEPNGGGFDQGVIVINRINYGNPWYEAASLPREAVDAYESDIIESHWANWLATDDFLQPDLNQEWIDYFMEIQAHPDHYLAKNTEQFSSQWLYRKYASVEETAPGNVTIDNRNMPEKAYQYKLLGNLVLAIPLTEGKHFSDGALNGKPIPACYETSGFCYLYLPPLQKKKYALTFQLGDTPMDRIVHLDGTYNVYQVEDQGNKFRIQIRMYGTQEVKIKCDAPDKVRSLNPHLKILSQVHDDQTGLLILTLKGRDMQGETGWIEILF